MEYRGMLERPPLFFSEGKSRLSSIHPIVCARRGRVAVRRMCRTRGAIDMVFLSGVVYRVGRVRGTGRGYGTSHEDTAAHHRPLVHTDCAQPRQISRRRTIHPSVNILCHRARRIGGMRPRVTRPCHGHEYDAYSSLLLRRPRHEIPIDRPISVDRYLFAKKNNFLFFFPSSPYYITLYSSLLPLRYFDPFEREESARNNGRSEVIIVVLSIFPKLSSLRPAKQFHLRFYSFPPESLKFFHPPRFHFVARSSVTSNIFDRRRWPDKRREMDGSVPMVHLRQTRIFYDSIESIELSCKKRV